MELFPEIGFDFAGGWTLLLGFYALFILLLRSLPKEVVSRLYELSGWERAHPLVNRVTRFATFA